ncbi:MAG: cytochrome C oxidase subunit IV [Actinobacteria bacterium 13_1_20CM_3_71_11]|nr:MAG: cytochrome C oxidase subunit IV [Actinobacteria bacterium 13_1_20CM_3_71_11]TML24764.1 MAG: cytochrome c oxidase subunit 4 [Actinomycetota bacterium]
MKAEFRLFGLISGFLYLAAIVYAFWTRAAGHGVEWIGTVALVLSGLLTGMCTLYFFLVARRIDARPEDDPDAEMSDGAGEVGFFSPGSYWPFGVALACLIAGIGLVYWQVWLVAVGLLAVLGGTGGLLFEYYTGARRAAE